MKWDLLEVGTKVISQKICILKVFIMVKNGRAVFISLLLLSPQDYYEGLFAEMYS